MALIRGKIIKETEKAIQVRQDSKGPTVTSPYGKSMTLPIIAWVPKSLMDRISRGPNPAMGELREIEMEVPEWYMEKTPLVEDMR